MNEYNRCYWFNNTAVDNLLRKKSQETYHVFKLENFSAIDAVISDMLQRFNRNHESCAAVLPINYNWDSNKRLSHCPLWAGLIIFQTNNSLPKVFVIDPFDNFRSDFFEIFNLLKNSILKCGFVDVNCTSFWSNYKFYDCGPLIIIHLDYFARHGKPVDHVNEEDILDLRLDLQYIYRNKNTNLRHQEPYSKISNEMIRKIQIIDLDKRNDIKILIEIYKLISADFPLESKLLEIGNLCQEISRNEQDSSSIRMKYGCRKKLQKNENNRKINFDKFYELGTCMINKCCRLSDLDLRNLESNLSSLKKHLLYILKEHLQFVNEKEILSEIKLLEESDPYESNLFTNIVNRCQSDFVVSKIQNELIIANDINYENVEDRYVFARVFTIIGNLSNQLDPNEFPSLKRCYDIRNKIIHCFKKIKLGDSETNMLINNKIHRIIDYMKDYLANRSRENDLCEELKSLFNDFKKRFKRPEEESKLKDKANQNVSFKLSVLITKAHKFIENNPKDLENKLKKLNNHYQSQFDSLNMKDRICYPGNLNLINKKEISTYYENLLVEPNYLSSKDLTDKHIIETSLIKSKISDIKNEIDYLKQIQTMDSVTENKKRYIIDQIICIVTQYVRDLSNVHISSSQLSSNGINLTNVPFDGELLKIIMSEQISDYQSIDYFYTLPYIKYCPIIALLLFNVGISFVKLSSYDSAIEFLKMALETVNVFIENFIQSEQAIISSFDQDQIFSNNYYLVLFGFDPYELRINRILAKVLHLANDRESSLKEFNKIHQRIQVDKFNLADKFLKNEIINFYIDYLSLLICLHKYNEAIEIAEKVYKLDEKNIINANNLLESFYKIKLYDETKEKLENVLNKFPGENLKFQILASFVMVCLTDRDLKRGIMNAKENFSKLKYFIKDDDDDKHFYIYNLLNIQIEFFKTLDLLNSHQKTVKDVQTLDETPTARKMFDQIKICENFPIIKLSFLNFLWINIQFAKERREKKSKTYYIEQARFYFEMIKKLSIETEYLKIQNIEIRGKFIEIFVSYISVYVCLEDSDKNLLINKLRYLFLILRHSNIQHQDISKCLVLIYGILAHKFLQSNIKNALDYLEKGKKMLGNLITSSKDKIQFLEREIELMFCHLSQMVFRNIDSNIDREFTIKSLLFFEGVFDFLKPFIKIEEVLKNFSDHDINMSSYTDKLEIIIKLHDSIGTNESNQEFIDMATELPRLKRCCLILVLISEY